MSRPIRPLLLPLALCLLTWTGVLARPGMADQPHQPRPALETDTGDTIPADAWGIIHIGPPVEASLYKLQGLAGEGIALIRPMDAGPCVGVPLRFVAGSFAGTDISLDHHDPIMLILYDQTLARALARGEDIVGDEVTVGVASDGPRPDIVVQGGLSPDQGFVLNPGKSLLDDIFGVDIQAIPCRGVPQAPLDGSSTDLGSGPARPSATAARY